MSYVFGNIRGINTLNQNIERVRSLWCNEAIAALKKIPDAKKIVETFEDPFTLAFQEIDSQFQTRVEKLQEKLSLIELIFTSIFTVTQQVGAYADPQVVETVNLYLQKMQEALKSEVERSKPLEKIPVTEVRQKKITVFARNTCHKEFMKANLITQDVDGLIKWVRDFYCKQYLQSDTQDATKRAKAKKILNHLETTPLRPGTSVQDYLSKFGTPTLAQLLGENRGSSNHKKVPWGLSKVMETFKYKKGSHDTQPNPFKPKRGRRSYGV